MRIHTEENTNINIIKDNCQLGNFQDNDNNCVLIITGSLNPVHRSHISNLQLVKNYLEKHPTRPLNVLVGYLSPTHDQYVRSKLGARHWIPAPKRRELCEGAIKEEKEESWLSVASGECEWNDGFIDFDEVCIHLAKFLNFKLQKSEKFLKYPLKVVYVCGLDHFNKCPHVKSLAEQDNIACAVIFRLDADESNIEQSERRNSSNLYYIALKDERSTLVPISSSLIRQYDPNSSNIDPIKLTYQNVCDYLDEKHSNK